MRSLRLLVEICDELCIIVWNILIIFFILQTVKGFSIQFNLLLNSKKTIVVVKVSCHKINNAVKIAFATQQQNEISKSIYSTNISLSNLSIYSKNLIFWPYNLHSISLLQIIFVMVYWKKAPPVCQFVQSFDIIWKLFFFYSDLS